VNNSNKSILIGLLTGSIGCLLFWIFMGNTPPLGESFPLLGTLWAALHVHLYLILLMVDPPSFLEILFTYVLVFLQWFLIARFVRWIVKRIRVYGCNSGES
jgi:hypothetical protein